MPKHEQISHNHQERQEDEVTQDFPVTPSERAAEAELDSILDEIDGVLEANAEEFVNGFVQRGGQ